MTRIAVRVVAVTFASVVALAAVLAARLSFGPMKLNWLTPYVTRVLSSDESGVFVRARSTELVWERREHRLRLRARDVLARSITGTVGFVPSLTVGISLRALFAGRIAPGEVVVYRARLRVVVRPDGTVDLGFGAADGSKVASSPRVVADRLFGGPARRGWIQSLVFRSGSLDLVDPGRGYAWHARDVNLVLRPAISGIQVGMTGRVASGSAVVPVEVKAVYRRDADRLEMAVGFRGLDPSAVAPSIPVAPAVLRFCSALRLPLDGRIVLALDHTFRPERARLRLRGGPGTIAVAAVPGETFAITRLRAGISLEPGADAIRLDPISFDLGGPVLRMRGVINGLRGLSRPDVAVSIRHLPVNDIGRYWPPRVASDARKWVVSNVRGGHVHEAQTRLWGVLDGASGSMHFDRENTSFLFDGIEVHYGRSLSPATGLAGRGNLSEHALGFRIARGAVGGLEVVRASVDIPVGKRDRSGIAIDASLRGSLAQAAALLAQLPTGPMRGTGIAPDDMSGEVTAQLALAVPLRADIDLRAMQPSASVTLREVSVAGLPRGWTLTDGGFVVDLRRGALAARGTGRLQGVPVTLGGQGDLDAGFRTVELRGDVGANDYPALGLSALPRFDGKVGVQAQYTSQRPGAGKIALALDMTRAALESPVVALRKRAGEPGTARVDLGLSGGALTALERFDVGLGGSRLTGSASFVDGGSRVQRLDARAVLAPPTPAAAPGVFTLKLGPGGERARFSITSRDAGALFDAVGSPFNLRRGDLLFAGTVDTAAAGWPLDGQLDVRSFTLTRAPILTRVATLVSLSGIVTALSSSKGIDVDRLTAGVGQRSGVITIADLRATGPALGMLATGTVDTGAGTLTLSGSLVPEYYGANRAVSRVPLLGRILTGAGGEGVQVFDFDAKGPLADPAVSVRSSSAAPGITRDVLRRLQDARGSR